MKRVPDSKRIERTKKAMHHYLYKKYNINPSTMKLGRKHDIDSIKSMRDEGKTYRQIGEVIGVTGARVGQLIKNWG